MFHTGYLIKTFTPENPLFTNALFLNEVRETSLSTSQSVENSLQQRRETLREFAELLEQHRETLKPVQPAAQSAQRGMMNLQQEHEQLREMSKGSLQQMWLFWVCSNPANNIPELISVTRSGCATRNVKLRLTDLRRLRNAPQRDEVD